MSESETPETDNPSVATRFKPGNAAWKARSSHGRNPIFETPEQLWDACYQYFEWIETNPEMIPEPVKHQGSAILLPVPQRRNMSEGGLATFIGVGISTWKEYKSKPDFSAVITEVVNIIHTHKMDGALTGEFNSNIVARELGLADRQENNHSGSVSGGVTHIESEYISADED